MELEYDKKDVAKSPKVKEVKLPEGYDLYFKRGKWCLRDLNGRQWKFDSEKEALKHANG